MPTIPRVRGLIRCSRRTVVAAVLLLLIVLGGFAAVVVTAQRASREGLEDRFRLRSALAARAVDAFVADVMRQEKAIASAWLATDRVAPAEFTRVSSRFGFEAAVLLDHGGRVLAVHPHDERMIGRRIGGKYAHLSAALRGRSQVSDIVPSAATGEPVVGLAVPFNTRGGRRVFSGAFRVEGTALTTYLRSSLPFVSGSAELRDSGGGLIGNAGADLRRDDSVFVAVSPMERTGWSVSLAAPKRQIFAPISGLARWAPWFLFAGFALAATFILFLVLRILESRSALATRNLEITRLMRAQHRFVSTTSHELRTPLTSVIGYLDILHKGMAGELAPQQSELLAVIRRNAARLLDLVADLMLTAQIDAGRLQLVKQPVALEEIVRETAESALPQAREKQIDLAVETSPGAPVSADPRKLAQVVANLVSNAVKFTPDQGQVRVRSFRDNGTAVIEVADTGMGIPDDEAAHLFERFFRSSAAHELEIPGTGLGLSIARQLTELHGGKLKFTTAQGVGTTFRVELPASE
jgi:signal transduction histidine kinase